MSNKCAMVAYGREIGSGRYTKFCDSSFAGDCCVDFRQRPEVIKQKCRHYVKDEKK
jgi:hypothetical protein